jgi:predicted GNAT superfamily acetyltransferase
VAASVYTIRALKTLEECQRVVELERAVWGFDSGSGDIVPAAILIVSVKRGGILLGAFDGAGDMVGFVYSLAAVKDGCLSQWSHMLGVLPAARDAGLGAELKKEQRRRALEMGVTLIEWTFDPLQALNAHLNFAKLGVLAEEYLENVYGESSSPLHRGAATDRLVAQWKLDAPDVVRRMRPGPITIRPIGAYDAPAVVRAEASSRALAPRAAVNADGPRVSVEIPTGFQDMLSQDPSLAREWRAATRDAFTTCFSRGYRAVDFFLDREHGKGRYLLSLKPEV